MQEENKPMTYHELKAKADELMKEANRLRDIEKQGVITAIREDMELYDITAEDLGFKTVKKKSKSAKSSVAVIRYRDEDGNEWTGRGRIPHWMRDRINAGAEKEDFAISKESL